VPAPVPVPVPSGPSGPSGPPRSEVLPAPPRSEEARSPAAVNTGTAPPGPDGKLVVVKGNKLLEGTVRTTDDQVIVRRGALDRSIPKGEVLFVGDTKDEVYRYMLGTVPATDATARLGVARWCLFSGLREQALTEAREVLKLQPGNPQAIEMVRSLEDSLKRYPGNGGSAVVAGKLPAAGVLTTDEPEPDVTPEAVAAFAGRVQPILANLCMECHARADHSGPFKLIRVTGFEVGPHSTRANLRATAAQLKKDDPAASPLLVKALTAHGGMREPVVLSRQAPSFRQLEAWVMLATGRTAAAVTPMTIPTPPVLPPAPSPAVAPPLTPPMTPPLEPPPVVAPPMIPLAEPIPRIPPALESLARPEPEEAVRLPSAATLPVPPVSPPVVPPVPMSPKLPTTRDDFGSVAVPKPTTPTGPTGCDEFDPEVFNKSGK